MRRLILVTALVAVSVSAAAAWAAAGGGNSDAAHACQQGGYANVVGGTASLPDPSVTFGNAGQCSSYAAHGGTLWQFVSKTSFRIDATNPNWQNTGIQIPANGAAVISTVNDGGGTCDKNIPSPNFCDAISVFLCQDICLANTNWYSAIGRVDSGSPFAVFVPGRTSNPPVIEAGPGALQLGFNDQKDAASGWFPPLFAYFDNGGYFTSTITLYSAVS
jgi:hypothetical protein